MRHRHGLRLASASCVALAAPALSQTPVGDPLTEAAPSADVQAEGIVITGVAQGTNRLDTSISISTLDPQEIAEAAPRSAAEILRQIPGIRAESSGGEGNANISVRGIPVSTGGSKFLQLQEDGLPIVEFGDIIFGNADIFLRLDNNIGRIESVRGGSASILASNSPGGIVNFISKDGRDEGGQLLLTAGLDFRSYRADFDVGGTLDANTRYHLGGFYRVGDGPREVGYDANRGGQIKANVTREFGGNNYLRLNFKYLDDRAIAYLPSPVRVTGTDRDPTYSALPGLSPNNQTIHSPDFKLVPTLGQQNTLEFDDIGDGQHPVVIAGGAELNLDFGQGFNLINRFRYSDISGGFISPFPAGAGAAQTIADSIGGPGSRLSYGSGPLAGQPITNPAGLNGNGVLIPIVLFNVDLDSLNNLTNDVRLSKEVALGSARLNLTGGFYYSRQDIRSTWNWASYLLAADGSDAALIDVTSAADVPQTNNGLVAYGADFFGGCCRRRYDLRYDTKAPFALAGLEIGRLNVDGGIRFDFGDVSGSVIPDGPVAGFDVNGDGRISVPESKATPLTINRQPIDYSYDAISYSAGATYRLADSASVFARYSKGARANADRLIFGPAITPAGGVGSNDAVIDTVRQLEGGVKFSTGAYQLYLTAFRSLTEETNFDFNLGFFSNRYRSTGVEAEGLARFGLFQIRATGTYTDAEITDATLSPTFVGNRPRRQAEFVYQVSPSITTDRFSVGANIIGTTDSFAQDSNQLVLPGFTQVNAFAAIRATDQIEFSVNGNNLFDVFGFTEAEEGAIPANGLVRARSINGRSITGSVRFSF